MDATTSRRMTPRPMAAAVRDDTGKVWRHVNPAELYRWVSRRNDLLGAIAAAPRPSTAPGR